MQSNPSKDNPIRRTHGLIRWLALGSLCGHIALLWWFQPKLLQPFPEPAVDDLPVVLEVALVDPKRVQDVPITSEEIEHQEPSPDPIVDFDVLPLIAAPKQGQQELPTPNAPVAKKALDLSSPRDWNQLDKPGVSETAEGIYFNSQLAEGVRTRKHDRRRQALLKQRQVQIEGLSNEEYAQIEPRGRKIKTDKGCFVLVQAQGLTGGETQWWISGCGENLQSPFEQDVLTYAPNGQIEVDP